MWRPLFIALWVTVPAHLGYLLLGVIHEDPGQTLIVGAYGLWLILGAHQVDRWRARRKLQRS